MFTFFFTTCEVRYLSNSSNTENPLTVTCTLRHSVAYVSPSRTNGLGCSRKEWFCFTITRVHTSPELQKLYWRRSSERSLSIRSTARTYRSATSICFIGSIYWIGSYYSHRNSGNRESFGSWNNGILVLMPLVITFE